MTLNLVTAPAVEPLTVAEVRARLNIGTELTDPVIGALISACRQQLDGRDGWLGRALNTQTWDLVVDQFQGYGPPIEKGFYPRQYYQSDYYYQGGYGQPYRQSPGIPIPLPPLQSVTSVKYLDSDGVLQTLDPATYVTQNGAPSHIVLANGASWPSISTLPGSVIIRFIAGYGDKGSDVPETVRTAITLQVSHLRSLTEQNLYLSHEGVAGVLDQNWVVTANAGLELNGAAMALLQNLRVVA